MGNDVIVVPKHFERKCYGFGVGPCSEAGEDGVCEAHGAWMSPRDTILLILEEFNWVMQRVAEES